MKKLPKDEKINICFTENKYCYCFVFTFPYRKRRHLIQFVGLVFLGRVAGGQELGYHSPKFLWAISLTFKFVHSEAIFDIASL